MSTGSNWQQHRTPQTGHGQIAWPACTLCAYRNEAGVATYISSWPAVTPMNPGLSRSSIIDSVKNTQICLRPTTRVVSYWRGNLFNFCFSATGCWRSPSAAKQVVISRKAGEAVLRGAQLFVPGVLAVTSGLQAGDLVAVMVALDKPGRYTHMRVLLDVWNIE